MAPEKKHRDIRLRIFNSMTSYWEMYKKIIIGNLSHKLCNYNYNDYEYLMGTDGEYVDDVQLECVSRFYPDTTFRV